MTSICQTARVLPFLFLILLMTVEATQLKEDTQGDITD
jgi:hypothetical protein